MTVLSIHHIYPGTPATHLMPSTVHEPLLNFCAATQMGTSGTTHNTSNCHHERSSLTVLEDSNDISVATVTKTDSQPIPVVQYSTTTTTTTTRASSFSTAPATLQRSIFKRTKGEAERKIRCEDLKRRIENKYQSPTDRLLSPCSQKLKNFRSKYIEAKSRGLSQASLNKSKLSFCASDDLEISEKVKVLKFE